METRNQPFDVFNIFQQCGFNSARIFTSFGVICLDVIGTDGTYRGWESGSFGSCVQPSSTVTVYHDCSTLFDCATLMDCYHLAQFVHTLKWDSAGNFIVKFGNLGDEKYAGYDTIYIEGNPAIWNPTLKQYEFTDKALADFLIPETAKCFKLTV